MSTTVDKVLLSEEVKRLGGTFSPARIGAEHFLKFISSGASCSEARSLTRVALRDDPHCSRSMVSMGYGITVAHQQLFGTRPCW